MAPRPTISRIPTRRRTRPGRSWTILEAALPWTIALLALSALTAAALWMLSPAAEKLLRALKRKGPGKKPHYGPDHFAEVARVYRVAWNKGEAPTKAIMERGPGAPVSKSTAAKWVARARELGFLATTTRGKAGGVAEVKPKHELAKKAKSPKPKRSKPATTGARGKTPHARKQGGRK